MFNNKYKIIIVGESGIGKTTIVNTYLKKNNNNLTSTMGTEYSNILISKYNQELQLWDCAGQERFRSLVKLYYRGAKVCIFSFDLNNINSLYSINNYWIENVKNNTCEECIFILVGNKSDLEKNTDYYLIEQICSKYKMDYIESSAIKNKNINIIFETISDILHATYILNKRDYYKNNLNNNENIKISHNKTNNDDLCLRYNYSYC